MAPNYKPPHASSPVLGAGGRPMHCTPCIVSALGCASLDPFAQAVSDCAAASEPRAPVSRHWAPPTATATPLTTLSTTRGGTRSATHGTTHGTTAVDRPRKRRQHRKAQHVHPRDRYLRRTAGSPRLVRDTPRSRRGQAHKKKPHLCRLAHPHAHTLPLCPTRPGPLSLFSPQFCNLLSSLSHILFDSRFRSLPRLEDRVPHIQ